MGYQPFGSTERLAGEPVVSGVSHQNYSMIETPYGKVVALEAVGERYVSTIVPGFYIEDLKPLNGHRRVKVKHVPKSKQGDVSKILKDHGYKSEITNFWSSTNSQSCLIL